MLKENPNFESTKNSLLSAPKPSSENFDRSDRSHLCNGKPLERAGSVTGEVVLCLGLVDAGGVGLSQEIHGTSFFHCYLLVPHIMGILS